MPRGATTTASASGRGVFLGRNAILSCKNGDIVDRRRGQHRLQHRDLLGVARARGQEGADRGLHVSRRRRPPVRPCRHPGARPGTHGRRHRRRRSRAGWARTSSSPMAPGSVAMRSSAPAPWWWARFRSSPSPSARPRRSCGTEEKRRRRTPTAERTVGRDHGQYMCAARRSKPMCGIVAIANRDPKALVAADAVHRMVRTLVHRGPDDEGLLTRPGAGLGDASAVLHGHPRRAAAVQQRGRRHPRRRQRRDLQLPRVAGRPDGARTPVPIGLGHRGRPPRLRGVGVRRVRPPARHVRGGVVRRADPLADRGTRSRRREAALLRRDAAGAVPRVRGQGVAGAAGGLARASTCWRWTSS